MGTFLGSIPIRFWIDLGHISFRTAFVIDGRCPKAEARSSIVAFQACTRTPVKGWREGADPRGHRHRLIGCATTRPLASALGFACIGQPSTLSGNRWSRCQVSQSSRNRPGLKRFEDKCLAREERASLSTRSLVVASSATPLACPPDNAHTLNQYTAHDDQAHESATLHE